MSEYLMYGVPKKQKNWTYEDAQVKKLNKFASRDFGHDRNFILGAMMHDFFSKTQAKQLAIAENYKAYLVKTYGPPDSRMPTAAKKARVTRSKKK